MIPKSTRPDRCSISGLLLCSAFAIRDAHLLSNDLNFCRPPKPPFRPPPQPAPAPRKWRSDILGVVEGVHFGFTQSAIDWIADQQNSFWKGYYGVASPDSKRWLVDFVKLCRMFFSVVVVCLFVYFILFLDMIPKTRWGFFFAKRGCLHQNGTTCFSGFGANFWWVLFSAQARPHSTRCSEQVGTRTLLWWDHL